MLVNNEDSSFQSRKALYVRYILWDYFLRKWVGICFCIVASYFGISGFPGFPQYLSKTEPVLPDM